VIFHEIYSAYYNAVAKILAALVNERRTEKDLQRIVAEHAFEESVLTILPSLKDGKWQLVNGDLTTPLKHEPTLPLSLLEKRWLKSISLDKRIKLFDVKFDGLDGVEPLFTDEDYYVYDKYADGDPYDDEGYIARFRTILEAISKKAPLKIEVLNRSGETLFRRCIPTRLEYSEKDDKFRMYTSGRRYVYVMNLARITKCKLYEGEKFVPLIESAPQTDTLTLEITDERNALERVMLHFAHFEKRAECIGKRKYRLNITYNRDDEPEMVIRILSFGPLVKVTEPEKFVNLIREKLKKQQNCGLK
jgi:hypothetical protein